MRLFQSTGDVSSFKVAKCAARASAVVVVSVLILKLCNDLIEIFFNIIIVVLN